MNNRSATLKDVARAAGVDVSTASRALTGAYGIHESTREKVQAAAAELNYRPNRVARRLVTGHSHSVGLLISDIRNPFFAELARGAEDAAHAGGRYLVLCNSDLEPGKQMEYVRLLLEERVEGIIINSVAPLSEEQQEELIECSVPVVLLNRSEALPSISSVLADNFRGGRLAAEYLIGLGHRVIAHLTGPRGHGNMTDRCNGFLEGMRSAEADVTPVVLYGDQNEQGGYELLKKLQARQPAATAVFAGNDAMAFGVMQAAAELGLGIPDDISLVGFDDTRLCTIVNPPLTTIHVPVYEIGRAAVEIVLNAARERVAEHRTFGVTLVERQSCRSSNASV